MSKELLQDMVLDAYNGQALNKAQMEAWFILIEQHPEISLYTCLEGIFGIPRDKLTPIWAEESD